MDGLVREAEMANFAIGRVCVCEEVQEAGTGYLYYTSKIVDIPGVETTVFRVCGANVCTFFDC